MTASPEPRNLMSRLVTACLLFLVAVVALTVALDLLSKIWGWVVLIVGLAGLVALLTWIVRRRQDRW